MDKLFEQFARGEVPTTLEVLAALNEISDMWPGNDCLDCWVKSRKKPVEVPDSVQRKNHVKKKRIKSKEIAIVKYSA